MDDVIDKDIRILQMTTIPLTARGIFIPMAEMLKNNGMHQVLAFSKDPCDKLGLGHDIKQLPLRRNPFSIMNIYSIFILAKYLHDNRVAIIDTATPIASIVGRVAAILTGVPIMINNIRGMFPEDTHMWQSSLFNICESLLHKVTSYYITINEEDRKEIIRRGYSSPDRVINMGCGGCGVDFRKFNINNFNDKKIEEIKKRLGLSVENIVIAYVGRLAKDKGIFDFVEAISILGKENKQVKGLVVGDAHHGEHGGINASKLKQYLEKNKKDEYFVVTGYWDNIPEIMAASDLLLLPTAREGFGMVIAEAAAMKTPAVAYSCRGTRAAIVHGKTGFLVGQGNVQEIVRVIRSLLTDRELLEALGNEAYFKAQTEFNRSHVLDKYDKLYKMIINDNCLVSE